MQYLKMFNLYMEINLILMVMDEDLIILYILIVLVLFLLIYLIFILNFM